MPLALITPFTPFQARQERAHGQGIYSYGAVNRLLPEEVSGQASPDPIRQSDTPARPPQRQIAITSTDPETWNYNSAEDFIPGARFLTPRLSAGHMNAAESQNSVGIRPNIERPPAVAYGSLFQLQSQTYDVIG